MANKVSAIVALWMNWREGREAVEGRFETFLTNTRITDWSGPVVFQLLGEIPQKDTRLFHKRFHGGGGWATSTYPSLWLLLDAVLTPDAAAEEDELLF